MIRLTEFLAGMLPLDPSGRRAVDETLADWRHEAGQMRTSVGRGAAAVRGSVAVAVALISVAARDVTSAQTFRIVGLVAGAALLMSIGFSIRTFQAYAVELSGRGPADARLIGLWASLLPQALSLCIPLALLTPPVWRVATRSLVGPCLVLIAISAVNLGWIMPQANQFRRQATLDIAQVTPPPASRQVWMSRGEYTVVDLVRVYRAGGTDARRAAAHLNVRVAVLAMVPVCLVIGVQARRLGSARRWRAGAGLLAWVTFGTGYIVAIIGATAAFELLRWQYYIELSEMLTTYRSWIVPIVCSSLALAIAWLAHRATPRRDDQQPIFF